MKKLFKALLLVAAVACCSVAVAFAGCSSGETYTGDYHYTDSYGTSYGMVVNVTVKDGKITKVENKTGDTYHEYSATGVSDKWTQTQIDNWTENLNALLAKYEGKTVEEVKAVSASIRGQNEATENKVSDANLVVTGATQCSARLLLAVQNALSQIK